MILTYEEMKKQIYTIFISAERYLHVDVPIAFISMEAGYFLETEGMGIAAKEARPSFDMWNNVGPILVVPTPKIHGRSIILMNGNARQVVAVGAFHEKESEE